jgi:hypothetical protein
MEGTAKLLAALEGELSKLERIHRLAGECRFDDIARAIERDLRANILPEAQALVCAADGSCRQEIAACYQRIWALLPEMRQ